MLLCKLDYATEIEPDRRPTAPSSDRNRYDGVVDFDAHRSRRIVEEPVYVEPEVEDPRSRSRKIPLYDHDAHWNRRDIDPHFDFIEAQVEELRQHATDENETFEEASAVEALRFCHALASDFEPAVFLLANGNLRAVWQNEARDQIGIQFIPGGLFQYVILRDRDGRTLKALGEDVSERKIKDTVEVQGLTGLWYRAER